MKFLITSIFICSMSVYAGVEGTVTATKLNIRVKPGTNYAVVSQAQKGQKVEVLKHENGWYEILAPPQTKVYVAASFVQDDRIIKEVHLRAGPSVAFSAFLTAKPGTQVKVIDKSRKDWYQILPPPGLTAWTSAEYVFLTPENAAKLAGKKPEEKPVQNPESKSDNKHDETVTETTAPLPYTEGKEKEVSVEGFLVTLSKDSVYVTHAIASRINGEYFPLCYVHSENHNLKLWEGRKVNVTGMQRWVKNWQRPVVEVEQIKPVW